MRKLNKRRNRIQSIVPERALAAQLLLKSCGLQAVDVIPDWDDAGDGYLFQYTLRAEDAAWMESIRC